MKHLYTENYKTLIKEIKEDTDRLKDILCLLIGKMNGVYNVDRQMTVDRWMRERGIFLSGSAFLNAD